MNTRSVQNTAMNPLRNLPSRLGRFLSGFIAVFWTLRVFIQRFYYDAELKRQNRFFDIGFTLAFLYLAVVFSVAAVFGDGAVPVHARLSPSHAQTLHDLFSTAIWIAGAGHFLAL